LGIANQKHMFFCLAISGFLLTPSLYAERGDSPTNSTQAGFKLCENVDVQFEAQIYSSVEYSKLSSGFLSQRHFEPATRGGTGDYRVMVAKYSFTLYNPVEYYNEELLISEELMNKLYYNLNTKNSFKRSMEDPYKGEINLYSNNQFIKSDLQTFVYKPDEYLDKFFYEDQLSHMFPEVNSSVFFHQIEDNFNKIMFLSENITSISSVDENSSVANGEAHVVLREDFFDAYWSIAHGFIKEEFKKNAHSLICSYALVFGEPAALTGNYTNSIK
jgi:hypothetical protein